MKIRVFIKKANAELEDRVLLGIACDEKEVWTRFVKPWEDRMGIKSYYVRSWVDNGYVWYDVGSWSYYVLIPLEDLNGQQEI